MGNASSSDGVPMRKILPADASGPVIPHSSGPSGRFVARRCFTTWLSDVISSKPCLLRCSRVHRPTPQTSSSSSRDRRPIQREIGKATQGLRVPQDPQSPL
jgi:hypothetical protein